MKIQPGKVLIAPGGPAGASTLPSLSPSPALLLHDQDDHHDSSVMSPLRSLSVPFSESCVVSGSEPRLWVPTTRVQNLLHLLPEVCVLRQIADAL